MSNESAKSLETNETDHGLTGGVVDPVGLVEVLLDGGAQLQHLLRILTRSAAAQTAVGVASN